MTEATAPTAAPKAAQTNAQSATLSPGAAAPRRRVRLGPAVDTVLVILALLVGWQVMHWIVGAFALPSPAASFARLQVLLADPRFHGHIAETSMAFGQALGISLIGGLGIGILLGAHRLSGEVAEPILIALYSIPKVTLYPVMLLIFGLGMTSKVAFGVIHGIIPVIIFSMSAVRNMHPVLLRVARSFRLSPGATAFRVVTPAILPEILTGFRVGFSLTLLGVLIGELFASSKGVGFVLMRAMGTHDVDTIMAVAILLFVFAVAASALMLKLESTFHHR